MATLSSLRAEAATIERDIRNKEDVLDAAKARGDKQEVQNLTNYLGGARAKLRIYQDDIARAERG